MIWLSWRQQRLETLIGAAVLAVLGALLITTGMHVASVYGQAHLGRCSVGQAQPGSCGDSVLQFTNRFAGLVNLTAWFNMVPLLIGILAAAPIVLEFEHGTHRLVWTQTITRRRWLLTRLGLALAGAVLAALIFTALMTWWRGPFDNLNGRFDTDAFDFEGAAPTAYTLFAAAVVLAVGTILRRTLPAIAIALIAFLGLRLGIEGWVRYQHYMQPLHKTWLTGTPAPAGEAGGYISVSGVTMPDKAANPIAACNVPFTDPRDLQAGAACLHQHHVLQAAVYQPASRFWAFQAIETSIFLAVALALLAATIWWVNRRIA